MTINTRFTINDYIIFQQKDTTNQKCGRIKNVIDTDESISCVVELVDESLVSTYEEEIVRETEVLCNLYTKPKPGTLYAINLNNPPKIIRIGDNTVKFFIPERLKEENKDFDLTSLLSNLEEAFNKIESIKSILIDKTYEILVNEGEFFKSSVKKSNKDFDYLINLKIQFENSLTIGEALLYSLSQLIWKWGDIQAKSDWLQLFNQEFIYDKINSKLLNTKFIQFLTNDTVKDFSSEDLIVCKLIAKEIKKVKCLNLKELKMLLEHKGENYITDQLLPEIVNGVRLKNSILINPLVGMNALKKFSLELKQYLISNMADPNYENTLKLFFD